MKNLIAMFLNEKNNTIPVDEQGEVTVFERKNDSWIVLRKVALNIRESKNINEARNAITYMCEQIVPCKIFIGSKVNGLVYNVLETSGFNIWELEGTPDTLLDLVMEKEEVELKKLQADTKVDVWPVQTGDTGYYFINLKDIQISNAGLTTKQVLLPFLNEATFYELTIICSHIPPWFEDEFKRKKLNWISSKVKENEFIVKIKHNTCNE